MTGWVILVDHTRDFPNAETPHKVITTRDYLARPHLFESIRPKVINLSRSYRYQSRGYYCSLLAEARGHRVLPTVEAMLDLTRRALYDHALPELEQEYERCARGAGHRPPDGERLLVCLGMTQDRRFERFARLLFDWFRCPIIEVRLGPGDRLAIKELRARSLVRLPAHEQAFFHAALHQHTKGEWRSPKVKFSPKYSLAVLHNPKELMAPSNVATLKHFAKVAEKHDIEVAPITARQFHQLAEHDALFIRETTSIDNHTYRFARRAVQEAMPVIDDPVSMIRCTNKVYLKELLTAHGLPVPETVIVASQDDAEKAEAMLGYPMVLKIPDGSFSRGVHKIETSEALRALLERLFKETDLLIAQRFMPTEFDWRIGVLGGEPLFACQYMMARKHWQIVKHNPDGTAVEGDVRALAFEDVPAEVLDLGVKAARLIGDGLYGVDVKQNAAGAFVIEINDNPDVKHGLEDAVLKDKVWSAIARWFFDRLDA